MRDESGINENKIESLTALRGIAFIGIFFLHTGFCIQWATLGVSTFFILSGFLLSYKYFYSNVFGGGYWESIKFSAKRISKSYPLHVITMLAAVFMVLISYLGSDVSIGNLFELGRNIILQTFLLQSWYPYTGINVSLNGVAWYLSTASFLYFMFPSIMLFLRTIYTKKYLLWLYIVSVLGVQIGISAVALKIDSSWGFYRWITYDAPFFRLGDFFVGCILGVLYLNKKEISNIMASIYEMCVLLLSIAVIYWDNNAEHVSFISKMLNNWTTIYIPLAAGTVYFFASTQGVITYTLSKSRFLKYVGRKSSHFFLIHFIIIRYSVKIMARINLSVNRFVLIVFYFFLTVLCAEIYLRIEPGLLKINNTFLTKFRIND